MQAAAQGTAQGDIGGDAGDAFSFDNQGFLGVGAGFLR
jgi:hypothetical protein